MEQYTIKINGIEVTAPKGTTILEAARMAGITIPTLCYLKDINAIGACRICVVEVKGARGLAAACVYPIAPNMEVFTHTPRVIAYRKRTLELLLSNHNCSCLSCVRSGNCELQTLCREYNVNQDAYVGAKTPSEIDDSAAHMIRDNSKCILCRRCVAACEVTQGIGVIGANERGFKTHIGSAFEMDLDDTACVNCGQCIAVCPTGALYEKSNIDDIFAAIADPEKYVVVQTAPAVRAALAEEFGYPIGTNAQGKMAAALRRLGFNKVFDTDFAADLTIMEEANEFLHRVQNGGVLPIITSCSPGWVKFCETYYPDMIPNLSTCKSPQQMFGAILKSYFAEKNGIDPKNIVIRCDRDQAAMYSGRGVAPAQISEVKQYDGDIYYVEVTLPDGRAVLPVSEGMQQCEVILAFVLPDYQSGWDGSNDFSNTELLNAKPDESGTSKGIVTKYVPVYVNGKLYYGIEPDGTEANGDSAGEVPTEPDTTEPKPTEPDTTVPTDGETDGPAMPPTQAPELIVYGDVDVNGVVDIMDVIAINKSLLGGLTLTDQGKLNADVDISLVVDTTDALNILKAVVKLVTLPVKG